MHQPPHFRETDLGVQHALGVDSYITPSWYATKRETGKVVPTWNYAIVQVRGTARVIDDPAWLKTQVEALTGEHKKQRAKQWAVSDAPESYIVSQLKWIVGVEIEITGIEGKWKASRNRPAADIAKVATGLEDSADAHANAGMAGLVRGGTAQSGEMRQAYTKWTGDYPSTARFIKSAINGTANRYLPCRSR